MPRLSRAPVAVLVTVLVLTGACGGGAGPSGAPATSAAASTDDPSPSAAATRPSYHAADLDLCERTDLKPLADMLLTVTGTDPRPPAGRVGSACLFEMRTADGYPASLRVEASTLPTAEEAERLYRGTQQATGMTPEGPVAGLAEEAEAFSKRSEPGFKYAEYMVHARTGNLVTKVWLAVGGDSYPSTETLATKVIAILKAVQAAVPTA